MNGKEWNLMVYNKKLEKIQHRKRQTAVACEAKRIKLRNELSNTTDDFPIPDSDIIEPTDPKTSSSSSMNISLRSKAVQTDDSLFETVNHGPEDAFESKFQQDKSVQTIKDIHRAVAVSLYEDCSPSVQRKRRRAVEQYVKDMKMTNFRVIENQRDEADQVLESLKARHVLNLTERQYREFYKRANLLPLGSIKNIEKEIIAEYPSSSTISLFVNGERLDCIIYDFTQDLKRIISWTIRWRKLPSTLNVTLTGDYGCDATKIAFFLSDLFHPEMPGRLAILSYFRAPDKPEYVKPAIEICLSNIASTLRDGIKIGDDLFFINL
ncbi:hypothetical protein FO519_010101, partial [Halicephalobus sp. NKZ332]